MFTFHQPEELLRLAQLGRQLRAGLRTLPALEAGKLWPVQRSAIENLERSLAANRPRALIQMTMGSGKTFTACSVSYRLIKFADAQRILFLVDRNNLGRQTYNEFQQYVSPYTNYRFTEEYNKNDLHADDIVKIVREEFGKGNDFCQKITSKTTGKKPEELLAEFRNSYNPRIAVTVDMIATGTDVKPLECLLFMRNINSAAYFEQMKGRGSRVIDTDTLRGVTPDAEQSYRRSRHGLLGWRRKTEG